MNNHKKMMLLALLGAALTDLPHTPRPNPRHRRDFATSNAEAKESAIEKAELRRQKRAQKLTANFAKQSK